jgi:hypothetical protein
VAAVPGSGGGPIGETWPGRPFLLMGSVAGAVDALERTVLPLGARVTVPGHGCGGPIDVMAALADMVAYNGGKPLTCLA